MGKKAATVFVCQNCAYSSPKWMGKCNECGMWNSFVEQSSDNGRAKAGPTQGGGSAKSAPRPLSEIQGEVAAKRTSAGLKEFDRVLGGGIVAGSLSLVGGEPGIGKSTLLLQVAGKMIAAGSKILYVSGEESEGQIAARAERLGITGDNLLIFHATNWQLILAQIKKYKPQILILDSIQTTYSDEITSPPGTVSQVREITYEVMNYSKALNFSSFLIGHVTKEGSIAGPKVLEHMVDTVIYFEGDHHGHYRLLRCIKNRFGHTGEVGIFEMRPSGLAEVSNPSLFLLEDTLPDAYGRSLTCFKEGSRTLFVEIQALVIENKMGNGRRTTQGVDTNRLAMILAVIEKYIGINFAFTDVYINVVGGMKLNSRSSDLSIMASILSSLRKLPIEENVVFLGELGLTGEIRKVPQVESMLNEVCQLNYKKVVTGKEIKQKLHSKYPIEIVGIKQVDELEQILF